MCIRDRIRTIATGAMGAEKIIPAVAVNQISSLAVDGDIDGFVAVSYTHLGSSYQ